VSWLVAAGVFSSDGGVQQAQGSERKVVDMVVHGGFDQRGEWHGEGMTCHGMVMFFMISCYMISEAWLWSRGSRRVSLLT
jgi:hypothetical protein